MKLRPGLVLAIVAAVALPVMSPSASVAASKPKSKPLVVVIGDSISSLSSVPRAEGGYKYNDTPRSKWQAWWSIMRKEKGFRFKQYAEGGSSWTRPGRSCSRTTFYERVESSTVRKQLAQAKLIVIAGGVNAENAACVRDPFVPLAEGIERTISSARKAAPKARIVVTAPWGTHPDRQAHRAATLKQIKLSAKAHNAIYVESGLSAGRTFDRIHPNRKGNEYLARKIGAYAKK